jgi:hypothetical protein
MGEMLKADERLGAPESLALPLPAERKRVLVQTGRGIERVSIDKEILSS